MKFFVSLGVLCAAIGHSSFAFGDTDLRSTLGHSLKSHIKNVTPSKFRKSVKINQLSVNLNGSVRAKVTVQYEQKVAGRKLWSARIIVSVATQTGKEKTSQVYVKAGNIPRISIDFGKIKSGVVRWLVEKRASIERYVNPALDYIYYTIKNETNETVKFVLPSGQEYRLGPGKKENYRYARNSKNEFVIEVPKTGKRYRLSAGKFKFFWMRNENRIGFNRQ